MAEIDSALLQASSFSPVCQTYAPIYRQVTLADLETQGVSLQSGQTATQGLQVGCVNPAALSGGPATLSPLFPTLGTISTPWVSYPGLYTARCEQSDGASWLNVSKATGPADHRPTVTEQDGPAYGYHIWDFGLAQENLISDAAAAEMTWTHDHG
jgi:hypothetical protein